MQTCCTHRVGNSWGKSFGNFWDQHVSSETSSCIVLRVAPERHVLISPLTMSEIINCNWKTGERMESGENRRLSNRSALDVHRVFPHRIIFALSFSNFNIRSACMFIWLFFRLFPYIQIYSKCIHSSLNETFAACCWSFCASVFSHFSCFSALKKFEGENGNFSSTISSTSCYFNQLFAPKKAAFDQNFF